jgi:urate oxidase
MAIPHTAGASAPIVLAQNNYGKSRVRLVQMTGAARRQIKDISVDIRLQGDFDSAHTRGDNSKILPTDTMKNTVYVLAKQAPVAAIEEFALRLGRHFLQHNPQVNAVQITITEKLWSRIADAKNGHPRAFVCSGQEKRGTKATLRRGHPQTDEQLDSGIQDLLILKAGDSAFTGYIKDAYTTLPETSDRILATSLDATWRYRGNDLPFDRLWDDIRDAVVTSFADHKSESVQHTLYAMGEAVLARFSEVESIHFSLPNKHCIPVNLAPFGLENGNEIFVPQDEPHGLIEGTVTRK